MLRIGVAATLLLPILAGCVSQVQLANNKGQTAECSAAGLGIISSLVAAGVQKNCLDRYQNAGYHQVAAPASSAAVTPSTGAPSAKVSANAKGQPAQCNAFGMGIAGLLIAASMQQTCIAQHGGVSASAATPAPAATGQSSTK
jgi:hypothetical protein